MKLAHSGSIVMERVSVVGHGTESPAHGRGTRPYIQELKGGMN